MEGRSSELELGDGGFSIEYASLWFANVFVSKVFLIVLPSGA